MPDETNSLIPWPPSPADRVRASKMRRILRVGATLEGEDAAWLAEYERLRNGTVSRAASRRTVHVEEEMAQEGRLATPADVLAAGFTAREEGRRVDMLTERAINGLERACNLYHQMCADMLARQTVLETTHVAMLDAVRTHYLARVETEGNALKAAAERDADDAAAAAGDPIDQIAAALLPRLLPPPDGKPKPKPKPK